MRLDRPRPSLTLALALALAAPAAAQPLDPAAIRDQGARMAAAVLGRICILAAGDPEAALAAATPGGEFGFVDAPAEIAGSLLDGRAGQVRVLRRPGLGTTSLVVTRDGQCAVMAERADPEALDRYLNAMVEQGGLKGGGTLTRLDRRITDGVTFTDYTFVPAGWLADQLARRPDGGGRPLAVVVLTVPPGRTAMEAVLSLRRP